MSEHGEQSRARGFHLSQGLLRLGGDAGAIFGALARHWLQRKRNIWWSTAEPSKVKGTAGSSKVWAVTPCSLVLIILGTPERDDTSCFHCNAAPRSLVRTLLPSLASDMAMQAKKSAGTKAAKKSRKRPAGDPAAVKSSRGKFNPLAPERVAAILEILERTYPEVRCALHHENAWQLLVATILSAQCTDVRVNLVTPALFKKYPTPASLAKAEPEELEPLIRSHGILSQQGEKHCGRGAQGGGGVSAGRFRRRWRSCSRCRGWRARRRTWCWARGSGGAMGIVVDTHVHRISRRLELTTLRRSEAASSRI